jgi:hypothetical protein
VPLEPLLLPLPLPLLPLVPLLLPLPLPLPLPPPSPGSPLQGGVAPPQATDGATASKAPISIRFVGTFIMPLSLNPNARVVSLNLQRHTPGRRNAALCPG